MHTTAWRWLRVALGGALAALLVALPLTSANAKWLEKAKPSLPYGVYIDGLEGSVVLSLVLDRGGHVTDTQVLRSSGSSRLDSLAQDAALKWRLSPDAVVPTDLNKGRVEKITFIHRPPHGKALPPNTLPYWAAN